MGFGFGAHFGVQRSRSRAVQGLPQQTRSPSLPQKNVEAQGEGSSRV